MSEEFSAHTYDESNFQQLFNQYVTRVHGYIYAIAKSDYIAEEVTQELFLILWRKRGDLHQVQNMDHYIFRIARNLSIALLKKAALDVQTAASFYKKSPQLTNEVADNVYQRNVQALIDKAVTALSVQQRKVYSMSRGQHLNVDEIAAETGLSRNTVKNHLQKALQGIREFLIQNGYHPVIAGLLIEWIRHNQG